MIRRPPRSTQSRSSAASDVYKRQPKSTVVRAGVPEVIDTRQIVPGDVILLQAGDRVPADARLFTCKTLKVDESMLTGESETVVKQTHAHTSNMVYSGTVVTEGRGEAVVVATGRATEFGRIAESVSYTHLTLPTIYSV